MDLFFLRDCLSRALEHRRTLFLFGGFFLAGVLLGMCFVKTQAVYGYHLDLCESYLVKVCFSEKNIFGIFLERFFGFLLLGALLLAAGLHFAALILPPAVLLYRSYTLGGSIIIFCSVYGVTGILVLFALYLPVHLAIDALLIGATTLSCARAPKFRFTRQDFCVLGADLLALALAIAAVCLVECVLLLAVFRPIGATF